MNPTSRAPGQDRPGSGAGRPGGGRRGPTHAEDVGLFGPSSVTWRLHAEPVIGIAGLRALLLQAMHPVASTGVSWRRALGEDIWSRYARTADFLGVLTFGSTTEALTVGARAQAEYAALAADPSPDREPSVDEIDLLTWVHCCLVDSAITVLDRSGVGLDEAEADRYVAEQLRTAALLGLDPGDVPTDLESLRAYFRRLKPRLRVSQAARADAEDIIEPDPQRTAEGMPKWASVAGLAFASLPSWARRSYSIPALPGAAALQGTAVTVALHAVRASLLGSAEVAAPAVGETPRLPSARERLAAPVSPPDEDGPGSSDDFPEDFPNDSDDR